MAGKEDNNSSPNIEEIENSQTALIQMYQAGFLDGCNYKKKKKIKWKRIAQHASKCFALRFVDKNAD